MDGKCVMRKSVDKWVSDGVAADPVVVVVSLVGANGIVASIRDEVAERRVFHSIFLIGFESVEGSMPVICDTRGYKGDIVFNGQIPDGFPLGYSPDFWSAGIE